MAPPWWKKKRPNREDEGNEGGGDNAAQANDNTQQGDRGRGNVRGRRGGRNGGNNSTRGNKTGNDDSTGANSTPLGDRRVRGGSNAEPNNNIRTNNPAQNNNADRPNENKPVFPPEDIAARQLKYPEPSLPKAELEARSAAYKADPQKLTTRTNELRDFVKGLIVSRDQLNKDVAAAVAALKTDEQKTLAERRESNIALAKIDRVRCQNFVTVVPAAVEAEIGAFDVAVAMCAGQVRTEGLFYRVMDGAMGSRLAALKRVLDDLRKDGWRLLWKGEELGEFDREDIWEDRKVGNEAKEILVVMPKEKTEEEIEAEKTKKEEGERKEAAFQKEKREAKAAADEVYERRRKAKEGADAKVAEEAAAKAAKSNEETTGPETARANEDAANANIEKPDPQSWADQMNLPGTDASGGKKVAFTPSTKRSAEDNAVESSSTVPPSSSGASPPPPQPQVPPPMNISAPPTPLSEATPQLQPLAQPEPSASDSSSSNTESPATPADNADTGTPPFPIHDTGEQAPNADEEFDTPKYLRESQRAADTPKAANTNSDNTRASDKCSITDCACPCHLASAGNPGRSESITTTSHHVHGSGCVHITNTNMNNIPGHISVANGSVSPSWPTPTTKAFLSSARQQFGKLEEQVSEITQGLKRKSTAPMKKKKKGPESDCEKKLEVANAQLSELKERYDALWTAAQHEFQKQKCAPDQAAAEYRDVIERGTRANEELEAKVENLEERVGQATLSEQELTAKFLKAEAALAECKRDGKKPADKTTEPGGGAAGYQAQMAALRRTLEVRNIEIGELRLQVEGRGHAVKGYVDVRFKEEMNLILKLAVKVVGKYVKGWDAKSRDRWSDEARELFARIAPSAGRGKRSTVSAQCLVLAIIAEQLVQFSRPYRMLGVPGDDKTIEAAVTLVQSWKPYKHQSTKDFLPLLCDNLSRNSDRLANAQERLVGSMVMRAQRFINSILMFKDPGGLADGLSDIFRRALSLFNALHRQRVSAFVDFDGTENGFAEWNMISVRQTADQAPPATAGQDVPWNWLLTEEDVQVAVGAGVACRLWPAVYWYPQFEADGVQRARVISSAYVVLTGFHGHKDRDEEFEENVQEPLTAPGHTAHRKAHVAEGDDEDL